jgi:hypothetical protein
MLIADAGKYHALLTAHLAQAGNELDVFVETADDASPAPVAVAAESLPGFARPEGLQPGQPHQLQFVCAPAEERPKGEKPGTCSHFVAKVPWMRATDRLNVIARIPVGGETYRVEWKDFDPKKYAHHEE